MSWQIRKCRSEARPYWMLSVIKELVFRGAPRHNTVCTPRTIAEIEPMKLYLAEIWTTLSPKSSFKKNTRAKRCPLRSRIIKGSLQWNLIEAKSLSLYRTRRIQIIGVTRNLKAWADLTKPISILKNIWILQVSQRSKALTTRSNLIVRHHRW